MVRRPSDADSLVERRAARLIAALSIAFCFIKHLLRSFVSAGIESNLPPSSSEDERLGSRNSSTDPDAAPANSLQIDDICCELGGTKMSDCAASLIVSSPCRMLAPSSLR